MFVSREHADALGVQAPGRTGFLPADAASARQTPVSASSLLLTEAREQVSDHTTLWRKAAPDTLACMMISALPQIPPPFCSMPPGMNSPR